MPAEAERRISVRSEADVQGAGHKESPVAEMPVDGFRARFAKGFAPERSDEMTGGCFRMPVRAPATDPIARFGARAGNRRMPSARFGGTTHR